MPTRRPRRRLRPGSSSTARSDTLGRCPAIIAARRRTDGASSASAARRSSSVSSPNRTNAPSAELAREPGRRRRVHHGAAVGIAGVPGDGDLPSSGQRPRRRSFLEHVRQGDHDPRCGEADQGGGNDRPSPRPSCCRRTAPRSSATIAVADAAARRLRRLEGRPGRDSAGGRVPDWPWLWQAYANPPQRVPQWQGRQSKQ